MIIVKSGYLVTDDWKTLITDECTPVIIDVDNEYTRFWEEMYYVPENVFNERIGLIFQS